jgi:lysophospholipase L1-like esterase
LGSYSAAQESTVTQKIVFLGDSITQAGAGLGGYVTLLDDALSQRLGDAAPEVIGAGISGNRVPDLQQRLERDVLGHAPNLVVIYIGINDVWHSLQGKGTPIDEFKSGLMDIIERIQATGSRVALCTPSVIGEKTDGTNELDSKLDEYATISRSLAKQTGAYLIDLRAAFLRELKIRNTENAAEGILTTDGVHLNADGNEFVRDCMRPAIEAVLTGSIVRHVVLLKFKPTTPQATILDVCDKFTRLSDEIDEVIALESGRDISPENLSQGYTHCFLLTFADAKARDAYLVHPAHKAFAEAAIQHVDGVVVVDYLTGDEQNGLEPERDK